MDYTDNNSARKKAHNRHTYEEMENLEASRFGDFCADNINRNEISDEDDMTNFIEEIDKADFEEHIAKARFDNMNKDKKIEYCEALGLQNMESVNTYDKDDVNDIDKDVHKEQDHMSEEEEIESLEKLRLRNMERNQKIFDELFKNAPDFLKKPEEKIFEEKAFEDKDIKKVHKKRKREIEQIIDRRSSARNLGKKVQYDEYELDQIMDGNDRVRRKRSYRDMNFGKDYIQTKWRISVRSTPVPELSVSEVTDEHIANISDRAFEKVYSKIGSSCHQCRQKTLDTKTYCRSGRCTGVRGQFCGPCLDGRYGESVADALYDSNWSCPPCRGICNCSICLSRQGYTPTGILRPYAIEKGYKSVKHYLEAIQKEIEDSHSLQAETISYIQELSEQIDNFNNAHSEDEGKKHKYDVWNISENIPDVFLGFE